MIKVPTDHNEAKFGDIAKTVLMPGDPLRAKYIADNYLEDVVCYNNIRGMLGFTGTYKGVKISVQGSGMGCPSMGIYSYELFDGYDVDNIIRIGSIGTLSCDGASNEANSVELMDIVVARHVLTDSNYLQNLRIEPYASKDLLNKLDEVSKESNIKTKIGDVFTSDVFYADINYNLKLSKEKILGVEMESLALYTNAIKLNKNAIAMFTATNNAITGEGISAKERQNNLDKMIVLALELAIKC